MLPIKTVGYIVVVNILPLKTIGSLGVANNCVFDIFFAILLRKMFWQNSKQHFLEKLKF